jgi:hypothetical protein
VRFQVDGEHAFRGVQRPALEERRLAARRQRVDQLVRPEMPMDVDARRRLRSPARLRQGRERLEQAVDVLPAHADADARAHGGGQVGRVGVELDAEQVRDERMRAEEAGPHGDPVLLGEPSGEDARVPPVDDEARDAYPVVVVGPRAQHPHPLEAGQPIPEPPSGLLLGAGHRIHSDGGERVARAGERDRAEDVRGAGLEPVRHVGPGNVVEGDERYRAAALEQRRHLVERVAARDEHAGAERRVQLVAGEREEVDAELADADPPVRRQLGCIDEDAPARRPDQLVQREDLARHVRRAAHGEQVVVALVDGRDELRRRRGERQVLDAVRAPGQEVGVMLERRAEYARAGAQRRRGEVDRLRRVADEDDDMLVPRVDEAGDGGPRRLVRLGRPAAARAAAAVHAAVRRQRRQDGVDCGLECRRRRRIVEVRLATVGDER